ncbi:MAG: phosphate--acyl-ACP acyltransferase, partial [Ilumatobacter sp.]|nr:phosphate--acyl-ACP acyltransferase [Ilumatobacter sp.]
MLPVAVDAMGGDLAPQPNLDGAHAAAVAGTPVVLVGPEGLEGLTSGGSTLGLIHASEVIGMLDDP